jgi:pimeloyl-ACP methyl ester carboxylesterase
VSRRVVAIAIGYVAGYVDAIHRRCRMPAQLGGGPCERVRERRHRVDDLTEVCRKLGAVDTERRPVSAVRGSAQLGKIVDDRRQRHDRRRGTGRSRYGSADRRASWLASSESLRLGTDNGFDTVIAPRQRALVIDPHPHRLSQSPTDPGSYTAPMRKWVVLASAVVGLAGLAALLARRGPRLPPGTDATIARIRAGPVTGVINGTSGHAQSGGIQIWYESLPPIGAEKDVVLLNIALGASSLFWPPAFLRALSVAGYRVVRYDQRGTGASSWMTGWSRTHPYSLIDMANDAIAVLDDLHIHCAHVLGLSLGGFIAQEIALAAPERVRSLTLMSTSADPTDTSMPGPRTWPLIQSAIASVPLLRYRVLGGETNLVKETLAGLIALGGDEPIDVEEWTKIVLYDLRERNGLNLRALRQHQAAVAATRSRYPLLGTITAPTLVIHGNADAFLPIEHGHRLAAAIPSASGLWLDDTGHPFPYPDMPEVIAAITSHLDATDPCVSGPAGR